MGNVAGETGGVKPGEAVHVQWVSEPRRRDVTFPPPRSQTGGLLGPARPLTHSFYCFRACTGDMGLFS